MKKGGGFENDQTAFIPLSTYTKMYNAGEQIDLFAIVSKPNANVNGVEEEVKQVLKAKIKFLPMIPMPLEVSIWGKSLKS